MTVGEQVKVLPVSGVSIRDPMSPIRVNRHKHLSVRLIHDGPAVPRDDSLVVRFLGLGTVATVQRPRRSEQIAAVIHPRMPSHCPKAFSGSRIHHSECHIQIILIEFVISRICQRDILSFDCQLLAGPFHCVSRNRQFSVDHTEGSPVLELSVSSPLHSYQSALKHSEPCVARNDNRL